MEVTIDWTLTAMQGTVKDLVHGNVTVGAKLLILDGYGSLKIRTVLKASAANPKYCRSLYPYLPKALLVTLGFTHRMFSLV